MTNTDKIKVEIWSDIACPFCYIGKHKFESALGQFSNKDKVEVEWHSFQLDPGAKTDSGQNMYGLLAAKYGITEDRARQMTGNVVNMANQEGLNLYMDKVIPTNTLDAHRLIKLATKHGLQLRAVERLFSAYFTEGKNLGNRQTLIGLGADIGLSHKETESMLESNDYKENVITDSQEGQALGLTGVPFFVINRKHVISGAQPAELILKALENTWREQQVLSY
jgi:predicted DsbA family dithiol-disulfide isomerase